jgi:peptidase E
VGGRILFNGNGGSELLERALPYLAGSARGRPPRVLLVTAAWGPGEYDEGPLREALFAAGLLRRLPDGENAQNLCAWHVQQAFLDRRPDVRRAHAELEAAREELRRFYQERTAFSAEAIRRACRLVRARWPGFRLGDLHGREVVRPDALRTPSGWLATALARELSATLEVLAADDARLLGSLIEGEAQLLARAGLRHDPDWQAQQRALEARLLAADAIVLLGGDPVALLDAVRFFDLGPAFLEALRRGATLVATSAGALLLCERMIVYNDRHPDPLRRNFQLLDKGLGLVTGLQILPHCHDRIHTDDEDNLAYLARRFGDRRCVGLNEGSYLLVDFWAQTARSVGREDACYLFGPDGRKARLEAGQSWSIASD